MGYKDIIRGKFKSSPYNVLNRGKDTDISLVISELDSNSRSKYGTTVMFHRNQASLSEGDKICAIYMTGNR